MRERSRGTGSRSTCLQAERGARPSDLSRPTEWTRDRRGLTISSTPAEGPVVQAQRNPNCFTKAERIHRRAAAHHALNADRASDEASVPRIAPRPIPRSPWSIVPRRLSCRLVRSRSGRPRRRISEESVRNGCVWIDETPRKAINEDFQNQQGGSHDHARRSRRWAQDSRSD